MGWVLLIYRVPREPSTPRIAIWRRFRALGVAQLADGTVALPEDARTREHLEWVADQVLDAGGTALLLRAQAFTVKDERAVAHAMAGARAEEYQEVIASAAQARDVSDDAERRRVVARLRKQLRVIQRRDYFPPPDRDGAVAAVADLARATTAEQPPASTEQTWRSQS